MTTDDRTPIVGSVNVYGGTVGQVAGEISNNGPITMAPDGRPRAMWQAASGDALPGTVVSVDVVKSSQGTITRQQRLSRALDEVVDKVIEESAYLRDDVFRRIDGDSATLAAGISVPKAWMAADFIRSLRIHLGVVNDGITDTHERLRLRVAVAHGEIRVEPPHMSGGAVRLAARLRELAPVRSQSDATGDDLTLVVSETFYDDVVRNRARGLDPGAFVHVDDGVKDGQVAGWLRLPSGGVADE